MSRKPHIIFLLVVILLFCSGCTRESAVIGGYIETDITPNYGVQHMVLQDETIHLYDVHFSKHWQSDDGGKNWTYEDGPLENTGYFILPSLTDDGEIVAAKATNEQLLGEKARPVLITDEGYDYIYIEALDTYQDQGMTIEIVTLQSLSDHRLFMSFRYYSESATGGSEAGIYDLDSGKQLVYTDGDFPSDVYIDENYIYCITSTGEITLLNDEDGSPAEVVMPSLRSSESSRSMDSSPHYTVVESTALMADTTGIYAAGQGGDEVNQLLFSSQFSFNEPDGNILAVGAVSTDAIYILFEYNSLIKVYAYTWSNENEVSEDDVLTVWALEDNHAVRLAIQEFRQEHPDKIVQFEIGAQAESGSAEDAINILNTELLSGGGPDIIVADGLNIDSYTSLDIFADLSNLIDYSGVYNTLVEPFQTDTGLHMLPTSIALPIIISRHEEADSVNVEALMDLIQESPTMTLDQLINEDYATTDDKPAIWFSSFEEMYTILWPGYSAQLLKNAELDMDAIQFFFESAKQIYDQCGMAGVAHDREMQELVDVSLVFVSGEPAIYDYYDANHSGSVQALMLRSTLYGGLYVEDIYCLLSVIDSRYGEAEIDIDLFPSMYSGAWNPKGLVSINQNSEKKELAGEFVSHLFSDSVQSNRHIGLPVTASGGENQKEEISNIYRYFTEGKLNPTSFTYDSMIASLGAPNTTWEGYSEWVYDELWGYCSGQISLEEAIGNLEYKFNLVLAERG